MERNETIIREYKEGDESRIVGLFKEVFGLERSIDHWNWQFKSHVQGEGWITLAENESGILAQYCMMHNHLNHMGREVIAAQSCDTMVRPDQWGKKWFTRLATRNYQYASEMGVNAVFGFPNRKSYPGVMRSLSWCRVVSLKYYLFRIGFKKVWGQRIDGIFKRVYRLLIRMKYLLAMARQRKSARISVSSHLTDNIDDLLREIRDYEVLCVWKDLKYMKWRYEDHPDHNYLFHLISVDGRPEGLVVTRNCGETIAICDVLHRSRNLNQSVALMYHVLNDYVISQAQKVEFYGFDNGFFDGVFKTCGFTVEPYSNFILGGKVFNDSALEKVFSMPHNWTIAYGDTDVI